MSAYLPAWAEQVPIQHAKPGKIRTTHLPGWDGYPDPRKVALLRHIAEQSAREPELRKLAVRLLNPLIGVKIPPRDYDGQAARILKSVQNRVYYVNEPGEILQEPLLTWKLRYGDCDDLADLTAALMIAIGLEWRFVLDGEAADGTILRWIEGTKIPEGVQWGHVYGMVGTPPFRPVRWHFVEPSVRGAPLGWDTVMGSTHGVVSSQPTPSPAGLGRVLGATVAGYGAMAGQVTQSMAQYGARYGAAPWSWASALVPGGAYGAGTSVSPAVAAGRSAAVAGGLMSAEWQAIEGESKKVRFIKQVGTAVTIGVATAVLSQVILEAIDRYRSR